MGPLESNLIAIAASMSRGELRMSIKMDMDMSNNLFTSLKIKEMRNKHCSRNKLLHNNLEMDPNSSQAIQTLHSFFI